MPLARRHEIASLCGILDHVNSLVLCVCVGFGEQRASERHVTHPHQRAMVAKNAVWLVLTSHDGSDLGDRIQEPNVVLSENNSKPLPIGINNTEIQYIFNCVQCTRRLSLFLTSPSLLLRPTRPPLQSPPFLIAK